MSSRNLLKKEITVAGHTISVETGVWARRAGGSILLRCSDMVVMANATAAKTAKEGLDFFPLLVEYREKFYSSGRIPGGFFKKEGRPTDKEVLTSRLTDRSIRPLFPSTFRNELQVFITLLSADKNISSDVHAITIASSALMVSNIPFDIPVSGVRVCRLEDKLLAFPSPEEQERATLNLVLAGNRTDVTMIEGSAKEVSEDLMLDALKFGHEIIQQLCDFQLEFSKEARVGKELLPIPEALENETLKNRVIELAEAKLKEVNSCQEKSERADKIDLVKKEILLELEAELAKTHAEDPSELQKELSFASSTLYELENKIIRDQILKDGIRADGRDLKKIREISIDVGVLPSVHGSSLFTRGETQSLGVVTLGTENAAQSIDDIDGFHSKTFYLHYNFPPYSVGEARRYVPGGRREVGHAQLAENALRAVMPTQEEFPYVVRVVSEILESNGSSSMATVCSASLGMMDAGVPLKRSVAGIAMGLIKGQENTAILTDIAGSEDHFGDMDFKVAGTTVGITAFQMDLKITGISIDLMKEALCQAKEARLQILEMMSKQINIPRDDIASNAPRIVKIQIQKDKIGELIGPGGKNIRGIIQSTGAEISIDDDGLVSIASEDKNSIELAKKEILSIGREIKVGDVYEGRVVSIVKFGAFIQITPSKQGLCHISNISRERVHDVSDFVEENEDIRVKVIGVDKVGKIQLSMIDVPK